MMTLTTAQIKALALKSPGAMNIAWATPASTSIDATCLFNDDSIRSGMRRVRIAHNGDCVVYLRDGSKRYYSLDELQEQQRQAILEAEQDEWEANRGILPTVPEDWFGCC